MRQNEYKQAYAFDGSSLTEALLKEVTKPLPMEEQQEKAPATIQCVKHEIVTLRVEQ